MRKYLTIEVRMIAEDVGSSYAENLIVEALLNDKNLNPGEVDVLAKYGSEIQVNSNNYAIPLPSLREHQDN